MHAVLACHHLPQMGGNSLRAGALCSRVQCALEMEQIIPVVWVLERQTIEALAARLADAGAVQSLEVLPQLKATISARSDGILEAPLSFQQASNALSVL